MKSAHLNISLLAIMSLLLSAATGQATMVNSLQPRHIAATSGFVFAGTVSALRVERVKGAIVTKVVFRDLRFAKGSTKGDSLVLSLAGGSIGDEIEVVDGQPSFDLGARYVVFALADRGSPGNSFMPVVGLYQGYFRVKQGRGGARVVHDFRGLPVVAMIPDRVTVACPDSLLPPNLRGRHFPSHEHKLTREVLYGSDDPGTRLTEGELLEAVRGFSR